MMRPQSFTNDLTDQHQRSHENGVMQNHQLDLISTPLKKSARQIFYPAKGISDV
jgi:hypothetical protein